MVLASSSLHLAALADAYANGAHTPLSAIDAIYAALAQHPQPALFISAVSHDDARVAAREVMERKSAR